MIIGIGIPLTLFFFQADGDLFKLTIIKRDTLRGEEIKTLNSIFSLVKPFTQIESSYKDMLKNPPKALTTEELNAFFLIEGIAKSIAETNERMKILINEAYVPEAGRVYGKKIVNESISLPPPGFKLESPEEFGEFIKMTPIRRTISIPYNYSIGVGVMLFLFGLSFVILPLIERKARNK
jgi:hypothetical protein